MSTQPTAGTAAPASSARSHLGNIAFVLTILSILAFLLMIVGDIAGWKGFSEDANDNSTFADVVWTIYALGGLIALITGIAAWVRGRSRGLLGDVRAGQLAVAWVVVSIAISVVYSAVT